MNKVFLFAILVTMVGLTANAQNPILGVFTEKSVFQTQSGYDAYRVNSNIGTTQQAGVILNEPQTNNFECGQLKGGILTMCPPMPMQAYISEFLFFKKKGYAFGLWDNTPGYVLDAAGTKWAPNTDLDGTVVLADQIQGGNFMVLSGGFTSVKGVEYPGVCKFDGKKYFPLEHNHSPVKAIAQTSGDILVTSHYPGSIDPLIQIVNMITGEEISIPLPFGYDRVDGIAITPLNVVFAILTNQDTDESIIIKASIYDTLWTILGPAVANTQLRQQDGSFLIFQGPGHPDLITTKAGMYVMYIPTEQFFDPFVNESWCPAGAGFADGDGMFGSGNLFAASSVLKGGQPYTLVKLTFNPIGLKQGQTPKELQIQIFPNPATDWVTIKGATGTVFITDMTGQIREVNSGKVYVGDLPKGIYFIADQKIVVQH